MPAKVSYVEDDDYSSWRCEEDARKVMDVMELMQDDKKWAKVKAHLEKKKKALMSLDEVKKMVEGQAS